MAPQAVCLGKQYKLSKRPVNVSKTVRLTNGFTRLERETRPRRTAGPGPARVLVHPSETWSHPRGTLGRCLKGSEINMKCQKTISSTRRTTMKLTYLGTAAAEGFPALFCNCPACREAARLGGRNIRTRSQALINRDLLLDL